MDEDGAVALDRQALQPYRVLHDHGAPGVLGRADRAKQQGNGGACGRQVGGDRQQRARLTGVGYQQQDGEADEVAQDDGHEHEEQNADPDGADQLEWVRDGLEAAPVEEAAEQVARSEQDGGGNESAARQVLRNERGMPDAPHHVRVQTHPDRERHD